jgi:hypothetical protein
VTEPDLARGLVGGEVDDVRALLGAVDVGDERQHGAVERARGFRHHAVRADAGVTWWLEGVWAFVYDTPGSPDLIRARIQEGPPRV